MTVLDEICARKRDHIKLCKQLHSQSAIEEAAKAASPVRGFAKALLAARARGAYGLIAEVKKASPSKGLIREDFDPAKLATAYQAGGATCLSVLTDVPYFQGHDDYLKAARSAAELPCLRKDFMLDPYQVSEARALGADCILLIMAALDDGEAEELAHEAARWSLDILIEVHDHAELDRALSLDSPLIGINNRNLKTLGVDLETTFALSPHIPADRLAVAESGLSGPADLARCAAAGVTTFLIGESLMRQDDVEAATRSLLASQQAVAS